MALFGKKKKEHEVRKGDASDFAGFVLLSSPEWDSARFIADIKADWDVDVPDERPEENSIVYANVGAFRLVVSMMPAPIPDGSAEHFAAGNYMWKNAVETVKGHRAHLLICILGDSGDILEKGRLYVKACAAALKQENAVAFYQEGAVYEPKMYLDCAGLLRSYELPVLNWIWFGLYGDGKRAGIYTYGMRRFGKEEMEVYVDAGSADLNDIRGFLLSVATYVIDGNVTLRDGETIGFTAEQKLPITLSDGIAVDGKTLKIAYGENNYGRKEERRKAR